MLNTIFKGLFDSSGAAAISVSDFLLCIGISLIIGVFLALAYTYKSHYTKSFVLTLSIIPAIVCAVIMMVNGSIGAGVAVAGTFSLVRFRSVPGTAKEIGAIFLAMSTGLMSGMGYLGYAVLFTLILIVIMLLYQIIGLGTVKKERADRTLRITIPENLNYSHAFDDLFEKYTVSHQNISVKTTNMGSLFRLTYHIIMKNQDEEKEFIDAIRCRNGNLEVDISRQEANLSEL